MRKKMGVHAILSGARIAWHVYRLRRQQYKSPKELQEIQLKKLKAIIGYAYHRVPYYRKLFFAAKFTPEDLKTLSDLEKIPVTTKDQVRENFSEIIKPDADLSKCKIAHTSGSTGIPLNIVRDRKTRDYSLALKAYAFMECGVKPTDQFVTVAQSEDSLLPTKSRIAANLRTDVIIDRLNQIQPDVLYAYANVLFTIAGCDVSGIRPRLIFSQGSKLTPHCLDLVRSAFGVDVLDTYGSVEFSRLGFECEKHSGLHMITDCAVTEFINNGKPVSPGQPGRIIVTGLYNYTMPLIRYQLDDIGVPAAETCPCGRTWPLIKGIEGKQIDFFTMPSGKSINPGLLYYAIFSETKENIFAIAQFQVVQMKKERIVLNIVKGKSFDPKISSRLKDKIEKIFIDLDENVSVDVQIVDEIPKGETGKIRTMVSFVLFSD